jgi:hypothetical protein
MLSSLNIDKRHRLRFVGALGTYASLFALGVALMWQAL